jgi:ADP-heptose:LPS heptosyltransferase
MTNTRENILLIRLKSIGDILFTLPAVHVVRENFPAAKIHYLVSREHAGLVRGFAEVDEIMPLDRAVYRSGNLRAAGAATFNLLRDLRRNHYSRVIDFHGYSETELLAWWSGAPERWGNIYNQFRGWLHTRTSRRTTHVHPVQTNLDLLSRCGLNFGQIRNEYRLPDDALAAAADFFSAQNLAAAKPTLFIQPFTSDPAKNWPLECFLTVAGHFHSRGVQVIFGGGPGERERLAPAAAAGFVIAAGTPLLVSAGLMKLSTVIVGADTGLLHLSVAMGKRVVMLMRSNAPGSPHPFQHPDWAVTPGAGKLVAAIPIDAVLQTCTDGFTTL